MQHGGGSASGTADLAFDADGDGVLSEVSEVVTVNVDASTSEVQAALRALGGLLEEVEVSSESGTQRARNGGDATEEYAAAICKQLKGKQKHNLNDLARVLCVKGVSRGTRVNVYRRNMLARPQIPLPNTRPSHQHFLRKRAQTTDAPGAYERRSVYPFVDRLLVPRYLVLSFDSKSFVRAGSAWLVTFPQGHDHELFRVSTGGMGGTSPFALVEEVGPCARKRTHYNRIRSVRQFVHFLFYV